MQDGTTILKGVFTNKKGFSNVEVIGHSLKLDTVKYRTVGGSKFRYASRADFLKMYSPITPTVGEGGGGGVGRSLSRYSMLVKLEGINSWFPVEKLATSEEEAHELVVSEFDEEPVESTQILKTDKISGINSDINLSLS